MILHQQKLVFKPESALLLLQPFLVSVDSSWGLDSDNASNFRTNTSISACTAT